MTKSSSGLPEENQMTALSPHAVAETIPAAVLSVWSLQNSALQRNSSFEHACTCTPWEISCAWEASRDLMGATRIFLQLAVLYTEVVVKTQFGCWCSFPSGCSGCAWRQCSSFFLWSHLNKLHFLWYLWPQLHGSIHSSMIWIATAKLTKNHWIS